MIYGFAVTNQMDFGCQMDGKPHRRCIPENILKLAKDISTAASEADPTLPMITADVLVVNRYNPRSKLNFHQGNEDLGCALGRSDVDLRQRLLFHSLPCITDRPDDKRQSLCASRQHFFGTQTKSPPITAMCVDVPK